MRERLEIRIHVVPARLKSRIAATLAPDILALFANWIRQAEVHENAWRSVDHSIVISWDGNGLHGEER